MPVVHEVSRAPLSERGADLYATGYEALAVLFEAEGRKLPKKLWEPCCGTGALVLPLRNRGYHVVATDLYDWNCPGAETGQSWDVEIAMAPNGVQGVITNPPFKIAFQAVNAMLRHSPYVAVFLPLTFLESEQRDGWFSQMGLSRMHIITDRLPTMHRYGWAGRKIKNSRKCYAWYVFDRRRGVRKSWETYQWQWKRCVKIHTIMEGDVPPHSDPGEMELFKWNTSASPDASSGTAPTT